MNNRICQQGRKGHSRGRVRWIAAALVVALALFGIATSAQAAWYNSNRQHRKKPNVIPWVKIASICDAYETQICMHCGNTSAARKLNAKAIWNFGGSNYARSFWHQIRE